MQVKVGEGRWDIEGGAGLVGGVVLVVGEAGGFELALLVDHSADDVVEDEGVALPDQGAGLGWFERVVQGDELVVGELIAVSIERPLDGLDRVGFDGEGDELGDERGELCSEVGRVELEDHEFDEGVDVLRVSQFELVDAVGADDVGELAVFAQRRECSGHQVDVAFGVGDELDFGEAFGFHDGELERVAGRVGVWACAQVVD